MITNKSIYFKFFIIFYYYLEILFYNYVGNTI